MSTHPNMPAAPQPLPGVGHIVAVGSGKGGVGKTTLSVNLAIALAKLGRRVGLLDADIYGPNVPLMLGLTAQPVASENNMIQPPERFGMKVISVGLLNPGDEPLVWRGPMLHSVIRQFLGQVNWGELDYLIVDLPPGTGDVVISLTQTVPLTGAVVVTTPSDVSLQDARKAIEMFKMVKVDLLGLVENMSYLLCPHCQQRVDVFSTGGGAKTAEKYEIPFLGAIAMDPAVRMGGDTGRPVALEGPESAQAKSLYDFARAVVKQVEARQSSAPTLSID